MKTIPFSIVGILSGAGVGSAAYYRTYWGNSVNINDNDETRQQTISLQDYELAAKQREKLKTNDKEDFIIMGHTAWIRSKCYSVFQRPSSRLEQLIFNANSHSDRDVRIRSLQMLATYWRQWKPNRRRFAARALSADSAFVLAAYGHQLDSSFFFPVIVFNKSVQADKLETAYVSALKNLASPSELRLDAFSLIFIKNALLEIEKTNERLKREGNFFKPPLDFWPFDSHVSVDEGSLDESHNNNPMTNPIDKKLELILTPISRCLESASRLNDAELAKGIINRLELHRLLAMTVRLESGLSDITKKLISGIVANLASFRQKEFVAEQRKLIFNNGFLFLLRSWALEVSSGRSKPVAYEAIRALKNLDPFFEPKLKSTVGLYYPVWRNVFSPEKPSVSSSLGLDVIFVHGVQGGAVFTWRQRGNSSAQPRACWPADWLPHDIKPDRNARLFGVQYHSTLPGLGQCVEPLDARARYLLNDLVMSGAGANGRRIVWVTHSFGGILVKSMLMQDKKLAEQTNAVVFLSTPHAGSPIADQPAKYASYLGLASMELEEIKTNSPHLRQVREAFKELASRYRYDVLSVNETVATYLLGSRLSMMVVPEQSALDAGCGRVLRSPDNVDHLSTCKPSDKSSSVYTSILDIINEASCFFDK